MEPEVEAEIKPRDRFCPECGAEETGYFCRSCGALLRGDTRVLCPRCRQVVPAAQFCNQCGQGLGSVALTLGQLAKAGDTFWVTDAVPEPESGLEPSVLDPDELMELDRADFPDWLEDLSIDTGLNEGQPHIYPSLEPIRRRRTSGGGGKFVGLAVLLMGLLLFAMMFLVLIFLARGGA